MMEPNQFKSDMNDEFRRFSASFGQLRLEQRQLKCSRNPDLLASFGEDLFVWPAKEPDQADPVSDRNANVQGDDGCDTVEEDGLRHSVTARGTVVGKNPWMLCVL